MENMEIYDKAREVPSDAQRLIQGGKLKGKTDINPMWRIKKLTELFGPSGTGWKTEDVRFDISPGANGEICVFCTLSLTYKNGEESWSSPVFGVGGSMLVQTEKGSLVSNDESYKMAYTDAISVACKALGFAANVYWDKDSGKYDVSSPVICPACNKTVKDTILPNGALFPANAMIGLWGKCPECKREAKAQKASGEE